MRFRLIESLLMEDLVEVKKYYPNISQEDFDRIIALDPTFRKEQDKLGTYGKWILSLFQKGQLKNEGHVKDILTRFDKEKKNLKNKDIMTYKSLEDLDDALNDDESYQDQTDRQKLRKTQNAVRKSDLSKDAEKVYEDSDWEVWIPHTYEASCKLGRGSHWCTASTEDDYYYNSYKDNFGGEYYININKHNPDEKYQFHFESGQFMDASDRSIDMADFLNENQGLKKFYGDTFLTKIKDYITSHMDGNTIKLDMRKFSDIYDELSNRDSISSDSIEAILSGDTFEWFMGAQESWDDVESYYLDAISEENWKMIGQLGATKEEILDDDIDVNDNDVDVDAIRDLIVQAAEDGVAVGSEGEMYDDFDNSLPNGIRRDYEDKFIITNIDALVTMDNFIDLLENSDDTDVDNYLPFVIAKSLSHNFYEPQYGWYDFDEEAFNDRLYDLLYEEISSQTSRKEN